MPAFYEVIYGGLGSGKSSYVYTIIDVAHTFKLGIGSPLIELLTLSIGIGNRHEEENRKIGLHFKRTTLVSVIEDIKNVKDPILLIDEWTAFCNYSLLWSKERIVKKIEDIFEAIDTNHILQRVLFICVGQQRYLPFGLYKKKALWNTLLFRAAHKIIKLEFGVPIIIKSSKRNSVALQRTSLPLRL